MKPLFRYSIAGLLLGSLCLLGVEMFARQRLGLGAPPLYVADLFTEYRLKPDQHLKRFGDRIEVNAYSMRSSPFDLKRLPGTRRVLVFGDSVVWGGAILDQSLIATEVLKRSLFMAQHSPSTIEVGNVAAPSWGPGNWLGWAKRFGFMQATDIVLVISSHDAFDNPGAMPFMGDANHPLRPPSGAIAEAIQRYMLPRLQAWLSPILPPASLAEASTQPTSSADSRVVRGLADLRYFLHSAKASGARVSVVQFADRQEAASGNLQPGNGWIHQLLQQQAIPAIQAGPMFRSCGPINRLYSDGIHPYTPAGQACLAQAIARALDSRAKAAVSVAP